MPLDFTNFHQTVRAIQQSVTSVTSLHGSSAALLTSLLPEKCLLLCASDETALQLNADFQFWAACHKVRPAVLVEPPGSLSRIKSLTALYRHDDSSVIASIDAATAPVWSEAQHAPLCITKGGTTNRDDLIQHLAKQGYHMASMVSTGGEISLRGGILDIFPPESEQPVRIEFFGDEIESLRYFDLDTQLSVHEINEVMIHPAAEPEGGSDLFTLLSDYALIMYEPDDIKRHEPDMFELLQDISTLSLTALPLESDGLKLDIRSISGLGLAREERKTIYEFIETAKLLRNTYALLMVCSSEGQAKRLRDLFNEKDTGVQILPNPEAIVHDGQLVITVGSLSRGFACGTTLVLSEHEIFGQRPVFRSAQVSHVKNLISSVEEFQTGDLVVHADHGIGTYLGIQKDIIEGRQYDFVTIEYLGGDKLFVPLDKINYVQRFNAPGVGRPKLDKLGGKTWQKTKQRVRKKIKDMADQLIKIYANRTAAEGFAFSEDSTMHNEFDDFFKYEETPDQLTSIKEIKRDMEQPVPMDRLLCGDVGYGKTEVVMRACFKAVFDSKQAAVLVPTTILAEQHYETFISRFSAFPVKIDYLSRFKSPAELKETLMGLADGSIDIVIGTHKLLGKGVQFADLGLLVIDEEHKFGVTHKERIKEIMAAVDVLTLSATPIPRTLHMAVSGIRGMSTIETPPEERLAVRSTVAAFNPVLIQEAIIHEIDRGGQVFFVHNRIEDIYKMGSFIMGLVPGSKVAVAHGQMKEKELEAIMHKFFHQEINVLVSTTIIGSGLDVPTANTIFINRSDRFGLADLYQLRGRVGRSNVSAYAYFLIPGEDAISAEAREKLQAIQEMGYLGAGFRLAMKDLEIRGAGNLLGAEQSGHIESIGFELYLEMLEAAVSELKGEKPALTIEPELSLPVTAQISEHYIETPGIRMSIYRKIANSKTIESLTSLGDELKDRFGPMPEETARLVELMQLKVRARELLITKITSSSGRIKVLFDEQTPVTPEKMFALDTTRRGKIKFLPEGGLELYIKGKKWDEIYGELYKLIEELA
ncbi:MAG: transcription-repair coupling factor [Nitrospira sp.]|nr:transcription-repair coupling factor [bacterium]MBL7048346.1 transcription-repair coupling factor [Nitrospira sp.]